MIIKCPHCRSSYKIEDNLISKNGRKVKCFNCANFWMQFPDGKFLQLKSENTFSRELARRQNLIKNSLNKKNIDINTPEHVNTLLSKEQEKQLLSSLAISEIEKNRNSEFNHLNEKNNISINRFELNSGEKKNSAIKERRINKSYLGFILVSIISIICFIFYKKPEFFVGKNTKLEDELLVIIYYLDILITNLIKFVETQLIN